MMSKRNDRNAISWEEKFAFVVEYVDTINFCLDVKIVSATIKKAFIEREGISHEGSDTMPVFTGTKENKSDKDQG